MKPLFCPTYAYFFGHAGCSLAMALSCTIAALVASRTNG